MGAASLPLPFLARPLGFDVNVPLSLELIDHVVPGVAVTTSALYLWFTRSRRDRGEDVSYLIAVAIAFLAGLWITATHIPLLVHSAAGKAPWDGTLWHSLPGLPIPLIALGLYLFPPADPDPA